MITRKLARIIDILSTEEAEAVPVYPKTLVSPKSPKGVQIDYGKLQEEVDETVKGILDKVADWEAKRKKIESKQELAEEEIARLTEKLENQLEKLSVQDKEIVAKQLEALTRVRDLFKEQLNQAEETMAIVQRYEDGALVIQRAINEIQVTPEEVEIFTFKLETLKNLHPKIADKLDKLAEEFVRSHTTIDRKVEDIVRLVVRSSIHRRLSAIDWVQSLKEAVSSAWKTLSESVKSTYQYIRGLHTYIREYEAIVDTF